MLPEITVPVATPAYEWVNGRALQKPYGETKHALAQARFGAALGEWACEHGAGMAGIGWGFKVQPPHEERRPLVPDVAFLSYARLPYDEMLKTDVPRLAPDVVVEILSPDDRRPDVNEKVRVYLAAGTAVLFLVDPETRSVEVYDRHGQTHVSEDAVLIHDALPGFRLAVHQLFSLPTPK
jgi:Uma2 family endonuclease